MRNLGSFLLVVGACLVVLGTARMLRADPESVCQVVDNTACIGQNRSFCSVTSSQCKLCDPHERKACVSDPVLSCYPGLGGVFCTGRQVGQCLPDPMNPSQNICQNWTYNGDCSPEVYCI